jgi:electron transfer flavoprotein alpha subunit
MLAVVPVRDGMLPAGGAECVAECGGHALLAGDGATEAAETLAGIATEAVMVWEAPCFAPASWAASLVEAVRAAVVVILPASPDGRDLAPRLAHLLRRPLIANATRVHRAGADLARWGGLTVETVSIDEPFVATLQPGVRGVDPWEQTPMHAVPLTADTADCPDADVIETLPPDVTTMDLVEAPRIVAGGAGLDGPERFDRLGTVGSALGASMGATRVVTDRGWVDHDRQIGTTGVVVAPRLYLAFGISGAIQHTSGLGRPDHIVSVNTDPHCPMMQLADLAIVSDANAVIEALAARLGETP